MSDSESGFSQGETPAPQAPKPAHTSIDPGKVDLGSQPNGPSYLEEKGDVMTPEGLLNRFKQIQEDTDPVNAILVTEVQEIKQYLDSISKGLVAGLCMACVIAFFAGYVMSKKGLSQ